MNSKESPPPKDRVTVIVRRRVKAGHQEEFEAAMRDFIDFTLSFPGHSEIHVIGPSAKNSRDYTVVDMFEDPSARKTFKASPQYQDWMQRLGSLTEGDPQIEEMGGLAGWFTLPELPNIQPPPKFKMAIVTFLGVYPLAYFYPQILKPLIGTWHPLAAGIIINLFIVASLTWILMPWLTRLLKNWLFRDQR